jgi:hypothetical protein
LKEAITNAVEKRLDLSTKMVKYGVYETRRLFKISR